MSLADVEMVSWLSCWRNDLNVTAFSLGQSSNSNKVMSAPPPGDPTMAKIGGTWFMYYGAMDGIHYATLK
jgi:hypothetical protein